MQITFLRSIILYIGVVIAMRLMGKRQLGELEPSEFAVTVMISELASIPIQDAGIPLLHGLLPIAVIVSFEFLFTFLSLRSIRFRKISCGTPSILIRDGIIDQRELRRTRMSLDELTSALRIKNAPDIRTIRYAILEPGGQLSVIPYLSESPVTPAQEGIHVSESGIPFTLISDGHFLENNLARRGVDKAWVENWLRKNGKPDSRNIFIFTLDDHGGVYCAERTDR